MALIPNEMKVTVIAELGDGTVIQQVTDGWGGNPLFHKSVFNEAAAEAIDLIGVMLTARYGAIR